MFVLIVIYTNYLQTLTIGTTFSATYTNELLCHTHALLRLGLVDLCLPVPIGGFVPAP